MPLWYVECLLDAKYDIITGCMRLKKNNDSHRQPKEHEREKSRGKNLSTFSQWDGFHLRCNDINSIITSHKRAFIHKFPFLQFPYFPSYFRQTDSLSLLLFSLAMFVLLSVYVCLSTFRFIFISASCVFPFKICVENGHKKLRQQKKAEVKERVFHLLVQLRYSCRHGWELLNFNAVAVYCLPPDNIHTQDSNKKNPHIAWEYKNKCQRQL